MLAWGIFLHLGWLPEHGVPPVWWHAHEMLFGFAGALIGGFLLTAVANWTGRTVIGSRELWALFVTWLGARGALAFGLPLWIPATLEIAYLLGLAGVIARAILATRNRRNYFVIVLIALYAALDAAFFYSAQNDAALAQRALLLTVDWLTVLMLVIGGRVIPFFTARRLPEIRVVNSQRLAHAVNLGAGAGFVLDLFAAPAAWRTILWLALATATLARLWRWRPLATRREPMLWSLHLGYLWLAAGAALRSLSAGGWIALPETSALHAITVGALGTLSVAMMTRVAQGHSGVPIAARRTLILAFLLPSGGALLRLIGGPGAWPAAAVLFAASYLIYLLAVGPLLVNASTPAANAAT